MALLLVCAVFLKKMKTEFRERVCLDPSDDLLP